MMKPSTAWLVIATFFVAIDSSFQVARGDEPLSIWPDLAPGETEKSRGKAQPNRVNETPPITRVVEITEPTMTIHLAPRPNGAAVVILPGGGFGKVVPDMEGSEAAPFLNKIGISVFVLSYRTKSKSDVNGWLKPLQDAQRAISLVRSRAKEWKLDPAKIGLFGFSAGGQVAVRLLCDNGRKAYPRLDKVDDIEHRPNFALLIYPWNLYDAKADGLVDGLVIPKNCPPTFLVHTDDDASTSLGTVCIYMALKKQRVPAELHVYGNGGHGYGLRPRTGSQISTWPQHATNWLLSQKFGD